VKLSAAPVLAHGVEEGRGTNEECDPAQQLQDKVGLAHWIPSPQKGRSRLWSAPLYGKTYDAGYEPIKDASGAVIGAYFVGYKKK
jgi:Single cache domain 3